MSSPKSKRTYIRGSNRAGDMDVSDMSELTAPVPPSVDQQPRRGPGSIMVSEIDHSSPLNYGYGTPGCVGPSIRTPGTGIKGTLIRVKSDKQSERILHQVPVRGRALVGPNSEVGFLPPTSEKASGALSDVAPTMVIWGTDVSVHLCKIKLKKLINTFNDPDMADDKFSGVHPNEPLYMQVDGFKWALSHLLKQMSDQLLAGSREYKAALARRMEVQKSKAGSQLQVLQQVKERRDRLRGEVAEITRRQARPALSGEEVADGQEIILIEIRHPCLTSCSLLSDPCLFPQDRYVCPLLPRLRLEVTPSKTDSIPLPSYSTCQTGALSYQRHGEANYRSHPNFTQAKLMLSGDIERNPGPRQQEKDPFQFIDEGEPICKYSSIKPCQKYVNKILLDIMEEVVFLAHEGTRVCESLILEIVLNLPTNDEDEETNKNQLERSLGLTWDEELDRIVGSVIDVKKDLEVDSDWTEDLDRIVDGCVSDTVLQSRREFPKKGPEIKKRNIKDISSSLISEVSCKKQKKEERETETNANNEELDDVEDYEMIHCINCSQFFFNAEEFILHDCLTVDRVVSCEKCGENLQKSSSLKDHLLKKCMYPVLSINVRSVMKTNCSESCKSKLCFSTPSKMILKIQKKFSSLKKSELHNFLLERLSIQHELGVSEGGITLERHQFCFDSMDKLFGVSKYMLSTVKAEHEHGVKQFVHGNKGSTYIIPEKDEAISFIHHFAIVHAENLPDKTCLRLPRYMNIKMIHQYYQENVPVKRQVTEKEFYKIFKTYFASTNQELHFLPRIVFHSYNTHPVCSECTRFNDLTQKSNTHLDKNYVTSLKRNHMLEVRQKYLQFTSRREQAIRFPEEFLSLGLDDMDQSKIDSPHPRENTKELSGMLKLCNHLTGVIVTNGRLEGDKEYMVFLNNDQYCQDSNKTVTIVFETLLHVQEKLGYLPRKLFVQTDNCSKDLKNQIVLSFYYLLVTLNIFEEIVVSHMPVGHTHSDIDQYFSVLASVLRNKELPTFEDLMETIQGVKMNNKPSCVKELRSTTNFSKFIKPYILQMSGHTAFYQFRIRKDSGIVKLLVKEDELDTSWLFPEGIRLLKPLPESLVFEVSPFREETEYASIFDSVWKKYVPGLKNRFPEEKVKLILEQWEVRIKWLIDVNESSYQPFDLSLLKQCASPQLNKNLIGSHKKKEATLTATFHPMTPAKLDVENLKANDSLVFYTQTKKTRPWIGLLLSLEGNKVHVQWLKKVKTFYELDKLSDGSPYEQVLDVSTIMFSGVLLNLSPVLSRCGPYKLDTRMKLLIMDAYVERDEALVSTSSIDSSYDLDPQNVNRVEPEDSVVPLKQ